jgi:hypothetical protein
VSQLGQARQCTLHNGQWQDRSMTLRSGVADPMIFKKFMITDTFWSLLWVYDCHQKIMSYNVVKKMTKSATPDLNIDGFAH